MRNVTRNIPSIGELRFLLAGNPYEDRTLDNYGYDFAQFLLEDGVYCGSYKLNEEFCRDNEITAELQDEDGRLSFTYRADDRDLAEQGFFIAWDGQKGIGHYFSAPGLGDSWSI